jgi:hypothetical protein
MVQKNKNKKKQAVVRGNGAYTTTFGQQKSKLPRQIATNLAGTVGAHLGGPIGGLVGNIAGHLFSNLVGFGDYRVQRNSLVGNDKRTYAPQVPTMHSRKQSVMVRHREYISDIVTSSSVNTFAATTFQINPGLSTFPWLSGIAANYTEYSFKGLSFEYISTSGDSVGSTTTSLPSVMMATQYRSTATTFSSKQTMLNEYYSCDGKASDNLCHFIECDPKENPYNILYVRTSSVPSGEDGKTYDLGQFTIATTGSQAASVTIGELWATYEVELKKPYNGIEQGTTIPSGHYWSTSATSAAPFGTAHTKEWDGIGLTFTNTVATIAAGNPGQYLLGFSYPSATALTGASVAYTNATASNFFGNEATALATGTSTASGTGQMLWTVITVTDGTKAVTITPTITLTTATGMDFVVTQLNLNYI